MRPERGSGTDEAGDGLGGLADLLLGLPTAGGRGLDQAVAHVLLEQAEGDRLESLRHGRDLGKDVDAVLLVLDHPLQTAGLALDPPQALEVVVLAVDVAVLMLFRARLLVDLHEEELYPPRVYVDHGRPWCGATGRRRRGRRRARPAGRQSPRRTPAG